MELLKEYAGGIIVVSVISILLENLLPETGHKKYIEVAIGLVVMLAIISPIRGFVQNKDSFFLPEFVIDDEDLSQNANRYIHEDFRKRLCKTLSEKVYEETGQEVEISVELCINENGEITEIAWILVKPYQNETAALISRLSGVEISKIREVE